MFLKTVEDVKNEFVEKLNAGEFIIDKSGVKTVEIIGAQFLADQEIIFGVENKDYIERELAWYKSKSLFVKDIPGKTPAIWESVASSEGKINSNYGWCIYHEDNFNQFENVLKELKKNPYSRRALMIYTRPSMHYDYNVNGMSDFMCTNTVQYLIREGKLVSIVNMRSNDAVFGYKNDYAWQKYVADELAKRLNIEAGDILWNVGSLHVYERHFKLINKEINNDSGSNSIV